MSNKDNDLVDMLKSEMPDRIREAFGMPDRNDPKPLNLAQYIKDAHDDGLRESLADLSHDIWAHWMRYLFSLCEDDDLGIVIPHESARRWKRQIDTPYERLTEREKASDQEQADKIIEAIRPFLKEK